MMDESLGYGVVAGGGIAWLGQMIWAKVFSADGKANDALVEQLSQRISAQEARTILLETGLDTERKLRRAAEDKVHALEMANVVLRSELARYGIKVDAALLPDYTPRSQVSTPGDPT